MKIEVGKFYQFESNKHVTLQYYILEKIYDPYYSGKFKLARLSMGVFTRYSVHDLNLKYYKLKECKPHPVFLKFLEQEIGKDKIDKIKIQLL
jgi:hypothetical protein